MAAPLVTYGAVTHTLDLAAATIGLATLGMLLSLTTVTATAHLRVRRPPEARSRPAVVACGWHGAGTAVDLAGRVDYQ